MNDLIVQIRDSIQHADIAKLNGDVIYSMLVLEKKCIIETRNKGTWEFQKDVFNMYSVNGNKLKFYNNGQSYIIELFAITPINFFPSDDKFIENHK